MLFDLLLPLEVDGANKHGHLFILLEVPPFVILYCLDVVILHVSHSHYVLARRKLLNLMIHCLWTDEKLLLVRSHLVQGLLGCLAPVRAAVPRLSLCLPPCASGSLLHARPSWALKGGEGICLSFDGGAETG